MIPLIFSEPRTRIPSRSPRSTEYERITIYSRSWERTLTGHVHKLYRLFKVVPGRMKENARPHRQLYPHGFLKDSSFSACSLSISAPAELMSSDLASAPAPSTWAGPSVPQPGAGLRQPQQHLEECAQGVIGDRFLSSSVSLVQVPAGPRPS